MIFLFFIISIFGATKNALSFDADFLLNDPSQQKFSIKYSGLFEGMSDINNSTQSGRVSLYQDTFHFGAPLVREKKHGLRLHGLYHHLNPSNEQQMIPDLYQVLLGGNYLRSLSRGRSLSLMANYGSASDHPFKDSSVNVANATMTYGLTPKPTSRWLLFLNYSSNRPFLNQIPLPGFAYVYYPSRQWMGVFGIPFIYLNWQFAERWKLTGFTVLPWVMKFSVNYTMSTKAELFAGSEFNQQNYLQYRRINSKERMFYDEKKKFLGAKVSLNKLFILEGESGYAFGRRFFLAESYRASPANPSKLEATWYGKITVSASFD